MSDPLFKANPADHPIQCVVGTPHGSVDIAFRASTLRDAGQARIWQDAHHRGGIAEVQTIAGMLLLGQMATRDDGPMLDQLCGMVFAAAIEALIQEGRLSRDQSLHGLHVVELAWSAIGVPRTRCCLFANTTDAGRLLVERIRAGEAVPDAEWPA